MQEEHGNRLFRFPRRRCMVVKQKICSWVIKVRSLLFLVVANHLYCMAKECCILASVLVVSKSK